MSQPGPDNPYQSPHSPEPYCAIPPSVIETDKDARMMGMLCHILAIPTGFVGPLVIWLVKKDEMPFVDDQGKESLNFQIMLIIAYMVSVVLVYVCIGIFMLMAVAVLNLVFCIMAAVKANEGVYYRYPINLRLVT